MKKWKSRYLSITILLAFSLLLISFRMLFTSSIYYAFLIWNIFLAGIPYAIALLICQKRVPVPKAVEIFLIVLWILFLPNAPYILTDMFHLKVNASMPAWYDLALIFNAAITGLYFYFSSQNMLIRRYKKHFSQLKLSIALIIINFLCAFGIYIGRYLRFNSWDILLNPQAVLSDTIERIGLESIGFTLIFGTVFYIVQNSLRNAKTTLQ